MVRDALRVGLGEAHLHLGREAEALHARTLRSRACRLAELIRDHQPCVALTGAGISTESGIPDFRSPTGFWAQFDPLDYASIESFRADPRAGLALLRAALRDAHRGRAERGAPRARRARAARARPGRGDAEHRPAARARREPGRRRGARLDPDVDVSALRRSYPLADVLALLEAGGGAPRCPACGTVLKPDVVFFGELCPRRRSTAPSSSRGRRGLLLVVGSSLEVLPCAAAARDAEPAGGARDRERGPTAHDRTRPEARRERGRDPRRGGRVLRNSRPPAGRRSRRGVEQRRSPRRCTGSVRCDLVRDARLLVAARSSSPACAGGSAAAMRSIRSCALEGSSGLGCKYDAQTGEEVVTKEHMRARAARPSPAPLVTGAPDPRTSRRAPPPAHMCEAGTRATGSAAPARDLRRSRAPARDRASAARAAARLGASGA